MKPFVKIMGDVITDVSDNILSQIQAAQLAIKIAGILAADPGADISGITSDIKSITYKYGTYGEIEKYIKQRQANPGTIDEDTGAPTGTGGKYDLMPLLALFMPFAEDRSGNGGYLYSTTFSIGIFYFADTNPDTDSMQRYNNIFEPILLPIYEQLKKSIVQSSAFAIMDERELKHTKIDLPFGTNDDGNGNKNIFSELLDAVNVNSITLTVIDTD